MADLRNWIETLWRPSYKGVPFYFDADDEEGGRNPVIHKFANRDQPYIEDLGEEPRFYSGTAYVHGDDADTQALALVAVLSSRGVGSLVLPDRGAVAVQALPFKRRWNKDQLGYIAFEVKFVRDGAPTAIVSIPSLRNAATGAVDAVASALGTITAGQVTLVTAADPVVAAVYDTLAEGLAAFDALRLSNTVESVASAALRDTFADLVVDATAGTDDLTALIDGMTAAARDLGDAMPADIAAAAMIEVADAFAEPVASVYPSPTYETAAVNAVAIARAVRLAALTAFADAVLRRTYASRPDGVAARAAVAARFADELAASPGADNAALYVAIMDLRGAVVEYLSRLIADLAPVITVTASRSLPALFWAWRLYADPLRAGELVARNRVRHPSFMPESFSALAR